MTELKNIAAKQILTITEPGGALKLSAAIVGGAIQLTLTGDSGKTCALEASSELRVWTPLTNLTGAAEPVPFTDPNSVSSLRRFFYRAVVR